MTLLHKNLVLFSLKLGLAFSFCSPINPINLPTTTLSSSGSSLQGKESLKEKSPWACLAQIRVTAAWVMCLYGVMHHPQTARFSWITVCGFKNHTCLQINCHDHTHTHTSLFLQYTHTDGLLNHGLVWKCLDTHTYTNREQAKIHALVQTPTQAFKRMTITHPLIRSPAGLWLFFSSSPIVGNGKSRIQNRNLSVSMLFVLRLVQTLVSETKSGNVAPGTTSRSSGVWPLINY